MGVSTSEVGLDLGVIALRIRRFGEFDSNDMKMGFWGVQKLAGVDNWILIYAALLQCCPEYNKQEVLHVCF